MTVRYHPYLNHIHQKVMTDFDQHEKEDDMFDRVALSGTN